MFKNIKKLCVFLFLVTLTSQSYSTDSIEILSKQATILDASSASELRVEAVGIYHSKKLFRKKSDVRKYGIQNAKNDAKKAAVYFLLYKGADPILSSEQEIQQSKALHQAIFSSDQLNNFISNEDHLPQNVIYLNNGKGIRASFVFRINKELIRRLLEQKNVIDSRESILEDIGYPQIMVVPHDKTQTNSSQQSHHAASVIESVLSSKGYDVILPSQQQLIQTLNQDQRALKNQIQDTAYQLALTIGSDIYIQYDIAKSDSEYGTNKMAVTLKAFEASTGRLLGVETGYSKSRLGDEFISIEEAFLEAIDNTLNKIMNYWKQDREKGLQYQVVFSIDQNIKNQEDLEIIQSNIINSLESFTNSYKERLVTDFTSRYTLWCDHNEYETGRKVWKSLQTGYQQNNSDTVISLTNRNRKMILVYISKQNDL